MAAQAALHRRLPKPGRISTGHLVLLVAGRLVQQVEPAELAPTPLKMCGAPAGVPLAPEGAAHSQAQQWEADGLVPEVEAFRLRNHDLPNFPEIGLRELGQDPLASAAMASWGFCLSSSPSWPFTTG